MQREIDSREFAEWIAYDRICPIGPERFDLLAGIIASATVAPHVPKGKKRPKPKDFMPRYERPEPQTQEEIGRRLAAITAAMG